MTDHLYREIDELRADRAALSAGLYDMIAMYETKKRNSVRLGKARAALTQHGVWPSPTAADTEGKSGA
jgi:hypothetical protein